MGFFLLDDDLRRLIQGELCVGVNGGLPLANDHLGVLDGVDLFALVVVLVVDRVLVLGLDNGHLFFTVA